MKHLRIAGLSLTIVAVVMVTGCADEAVLEERLAASVPGTFVPLRVPDESNPALVARDQPHALPQLREQHEEASEAVRAFRERIGALSIEERDAEARRLIASFEGHLFQYEVEQVLSNQVLRALLEDGQAEPAAIAYHTAVLLRNGHPDASVMVPALERLERVWPQETHRQAVDQTLADAQWWLERNPCDECLGDDVQAEEIVDARTRRTYEISASIPRLERMRSERVVTDR